MTGEGFSAARRRLGTYELVRPLANGGMANIYLARKAGPGDFERHVALKVLNATRAEDPEACTMFIDEARVVAMLNHQNIASVLDIDVDENGRHYLAMEYVHGADLRELLSAAAHANTSLPYETSIAIVMGAAAGLDHAHRRSGPDGRPLRLVHRDVSLSNIMVGHDGSVKVVDFGIATTTLATIHTCPGIVRGKASYMSPEQCLGDKVDHRTDVFALGIVLYELTTGARCFSGKSDFDRMLAVVRGEYIPPHDIVPDFPADLEEVIRTALATSAAQRYPSAAALIHALEHVLHARTWQGGAMAIARAMQELFGEVPEPWTMAAAEQHITSTAAPVAPQRLARGTEAPLPPAQPLARGSDADIVLDRLRIPLGTAACPGEAGACDRSFYPTPRPPAAAIVDDDDDEPTRGRRAFKRPPSSPIVCG